MRKTVLILFVAIALVGCKSEAEKITENYLLEKELPESSAAAALINAEIKDYSIRNFNPNPKDTIYMYDDYDYTYQSAELDYSFSKGRLEHMLKANTEYSFVMYSENKIKESKESVKTDSFKFANAQITLQKYKENKEIAALGYEFDLHTKIKLAGKNIEKTQHKICYINTDGSVRKIINKQSE